MLPQPNWQFPPDHRISLFSVKDVLSPVSPLLTVIRSAPKLVNIIKLSNL